MSEGQGASDTDQSRVLTLRFSLLRASNLPDSRGGLSKYFVTLETRAGWTDRTSRKRGKNPEWNKEFLCDVKSTSPTLSIEVFRIGLINQKAKLVAIASPDVARCLHSSSTGILDERCPLLSPTSHTPLGKATIFYSCTLHHDGQPASELTSSALQKLVRGESTIHGLTTPGDAGLATATSFLPSDATRGIINVLRKIDQVGQIITEVHPYAKLAWTVLNATQRALADQIERDDRILGLWETVKSTVDLVDPLGKLKDMPLYQKTVEAMLKQVYECVLFLRWYANKGFAGRVARDTLSDTANSAIKKFENAFRDLLKKLQDGFSVDHIMQTYRLVAATERSADIAEDEHLDRLPGATLSSVEYDKNKACLPGTRKKLLEDIEEWIHTPGDGPERILWLSGPAGTGKSSVANSIAERMDSLGRLAASFRFDRGQANRTPAVLIGNLCRQLARFDNSLRGAILDAMKQHGSGGSMPCSSQATKLFVAPISKTEIIGPIVIIIDALDESGNDEPITGGTSRQDLVRTIVKESLHLPSFVKLLITSREEGSIPGILSQHSRLCKRLLITETPDVEVDIQAFIEVEMGNIRDSKQRGSNWPGDEKVRALTHYANGLFICAAVACNFINDGRNPDSQMRKVLDPSGSSQLPALDNLYTIVVKQSLGGDKSDKEERDNWLRVVGTILVVRKPLTVKDMDALLGLPTDSLQTTNDFINSLLPLLQVDKDKRVQLLHKSVFDFLTTRTSVPAVWHTIDLAIWHQRLAIDCLTYMNKHLSYEMSWISLSEPTSSCNTSALRYACRHFATHFLESTSDHFPCINQLRTFLSEHLLHWFEVMARLREIYMAEESLKLLLGWLMVSSAKWDGNGENAKINDLSNIISDGISFLRTFRGMCTISPMHTYRSGIPMSPKESQIYKLYSGCMRLPGVTSSSLLWSRSLCVFEGHTGGVRSVAFSRGGLVASGSEDKTVRLWDAEKGEAIGSALEGHRMGVTSVVFSPDGKKVASGSSDGIVRLWDAEKGEAIGSAVEGHHGWLTSIVFSPDGQTVASGALDSTVRLWDAKKGGAIGLLEGHGSRISVMVFSPDGKKFASGLLDNTVRLWGVKNGDAIGPALQGHGSRVTTMVFSPDGKKVASGSLDKTVRLWNAEKGEAIGSALQGHSSGLTSMVFSPDGKKVASGSWDHTVRLWDVEKGEAVGSALQGHGSRVTSIAFSPDGKKIASGSWDSTVRLWDVEKGEAIGSALEGHGSGVTSIVFSPDGKTVASGSADSTVRVWDVEREEANRSDVEGHGCEVTSIVLSLDGKRVASGSSDGIVRLWDAEKGEAIGSALRGHGTRVTSIVFSPDGRKVASGSSNGTVRLWDVEKGEAIGSALEGHHGWLTSIVFSPDGQKVASGSLDNTVRLWDADTGEAIGSALEGHRHWVTSIVFSPDGKTIASGSWDNTVRLWDAEKGEAIGSALEGHRDTVTSVVFSPEGTQISSGSSDGVRVWDVQLGRLVAVHDSYPDIFNLAFVRHDRSSSIDAKTADLCTDAPVSLSRPTIDDTGFLVTSDGHQLIWIPAHLRGDKIAFHLSTRTVVVGGTNGAITIILP